MTADLDLPMRPHAFPHPDRPGTPPGAGLLPQLHRAARLAPGASLPPSLLLAAAAALAPAGVLPAQTPSRSLPTVTIEFNGPAVKESLPFDVPFLFTGTAPAGVEQLEVWVRCVVPAGAKKEPADCQKRTDAAPRNTRCGEEGWQKSPAWVRRPADAGQSSTFSVLVEPVQVNRSYDLCLASKALISEQERATAATKARETIDQRFRNSSTGSLTVEEVRALRRRLIEDLKSATQADQVIAAGTMFDPEVPDSEVRSRFVNAAGDIRSQQRNLFGRRGDWESAHPYYKQYLDSALVAGSTASFLRALKMHLLTASKTTPQIKAFLETPRAKLALGLLDATTTETRRWATGESGIPAGELAPLLNGTWSVSEAERVENHYLQQRNALSELLNFVRDLANPAFPHHPHVAALVRKSIRPGSGPQSLADVTRRGSPLPQAVMQAETMGELAGKIRGLIAARGQEVGRLSREFEIDSRDARVGRTNSMGNLALYRGWHASADVGLAWTPELGGVLPYLGLNLYFRPVNRDAKLGGIRDPRRYSATLGVSTESVKEAGRRDDLLGTRALLLGAGGRVNEIIRLGGGLVFFEALDTNPLRPSSSLAATWYLNASLDLNVSEIPLLDQLF